VESPFSEENAFSPRSRNFAALNRTLSSKQDGTAPNYFAYSYVKVDGESYEKLDEQFGVEKVKASK
jgi:hypothetical protein